MKTQLKTFLAIFTLFTLYACATPKEIRSSAEFTAGQISVLQSDVKTAVAGFNDGMKSRKDLLNDERRETLQGVVAEEWELALIGDPALNGRYNNLLEKINGYATSDEAAKLQRIRFEKELADLAPAIKMDGKALKEASQALQALGKKESKEELLALYGSFIAEARKEYKARQKLEAQ